MMEFKYRTKGNASPQGKPRVFFTCHPEDFDRAFDKICEDAFRTHDCAIYYTENLDAEIPEDNRAIDLERMNLFVIPVTFKLLSTPNRAMDCDFPYAIGKHIPVLPILLEPGLDAVYSRKDKFGDLQYLDPYSYDSTAICYEEKLKKYLDSVLIDDKTAERVRAAFDAYIFLSYRKKDRQYANELMRIIHRDPIFRDIAIWYDEFLTPGENFNDIIAKALEKSELFTLLVTPNLVNEENYVRSVEYPAAYETGKAILPAEMETTDLTELQKQFEGIPDCVNVYQEDAFRQRLLSSLTRLALRKNDNDPAHNFLIGLAYLEGIDVEVDRTRALELITAAAVSQLPEAMEKLAEMYHEGTGVDRDYGSAVTWRQRIADYYERLYVAGKSLSTANQYISALFKLALYAFDRERFNKEEGIFLSTSKHIIELLKMTSSEYSDDVRSSLAVCYSNIGYYYSINLPLWRFDLAEENLLAALDLYIQLSLESKSYLPKLADTYRNLGKTYYWYNKFDDSKKMYVSALDIISEIRAGGIHDYDSKKSQIYCELADLYRRYKVYDQAEQAYLHSIHILHELKRVTDSYANNSLVFVYQELSKLYISLERYSEAEKWLLEGLALAEQATSKVTQEYAHRDANATMKDTLRMRTSSISDIIRKLEGVYQATAEKEKLIALRRHAISFFSQLVHLVPSVFNPLLGTQEHELAGLLFDAGNLEEAEHTYEQAILLFEKCIPEDQSYHFSLSEACNDLAVMYHKKDQYDKAEQMHLRALSTRKYCAEALRGEYANTVLARTYVNLGLLYLDTKRYDEAVQMYHAAIDLYTQLADYYNLAKAFIRLGDLYRIMQRFEEGERSFLTAMDFSKWHDEKEDSDFEPILADAHDGLSYLYKKQGNQEKADIEAARAREIACRYPSHPLCKRILNR